MTTKTLPDYILETADGFKVTLNKPLDVDGAKSYDVVMREPTVQDLLAAEMQSKGQGESAMEITMFANLCGLAPENIKSATLRDYKRLQEAFELFTD